MGDSGKSSSGTAGKPAPSVDATYVRIGRNFSFNSADVNVEALRRAYTKAASTLVMNKVHFANCGEVCNLDDVDRSYADLQAWNIVCRGANSPCQSGFKNAVIKALRGLKHAIGAEENSWGCRLLGDCSGVHADAAYYLPSSDEEPYLYRGVWPTHDGYSDALRGVVKPRDSNSKITIEQHNVGYPPEPSPFTSWTTDYWLARERAQDGVVLQIENEDGTVYERVASPDFLDENEVGIKGDVTGAKVYRPGEIPPEVIP